MHIPTPRKVVSAEEKSPEVEEMEVVTAQLSQKLCIEDIDAADSSNPQLCVEYVKEIYQYMMMLEVRHRLKLMWWLPRLIRPPIKGVCLREVASFQRRSTLDNLGR